jgi:hypothetical protein
LNVESPCKAGLPNTAGSELAKCKLDLVAVQEVRWGKDGSEPTDSYTFSCGNGNAICNMGTGFFICQGIRLAIYRVKFIKDVICNTERSLV